MSFLPEAYEMPKQKGGYMRFKKGKNSFRILSDAIVGSVGWVLEDGKNKPLRFKFKENIDIKRNWVNGKMPRHFWAFVVWNYEESSIQILEITQVTIQEAIRTFVENEKWGDPKKYDVVVKKDGDGMDTVYSVVPEPKEEIDKEIIKQYKEMNIDLTRLFDGLDPFKQDPNPKTVSIEEIPF